MEQVTDPVTTHGEGPVWHADEGRLRWVDMMSGDILAMALDGPGRIERVRVGKVAAALRPRRGGGLVVGVERGFRLLDPGSHRPGPLIPAWERDGLRMNDGACDAQGRFYCGSMAYDQTPGAGSLYRLDPDGTVTTVLSDVTVSNGIAWTPEGTTAYYVDSATQRLDAFDVDTDRGLLHGRRTVVEVPEDAGIPDGITLDADGGIWVALYDGGAVRRYTPEGRLDEVVEVPVRKVTACTFAGPELDQLLVTTSREGFGPGEGEPEAGALFRVRPGTRGIPVHAFAG